ncbi:MAG: hypothetical protein GEU73_12215 [Chloroflexi bacterium]|nr:hypothetical protein [Chloroflexota bacterium]
MPHKVREHISSFLIILLTFSALALGTTSALGQTSESPPPHSGAIQWANPRCAELIEQGPFVPVETPDGMSCQYAWANPECEELVAAHGWIAKATPEGGTCISPEEWKAMHARPTEPHPATGGPWVYTVCSPGEERRWTDLREVTDPTPFPHDDELLERNMKEYEPPCGKPGRMWIGGR